MSTPICIREIRVKLYVLCNDALSNFGCGEVGLEQYTTHRKYVMRLVSNSDDNAKGTTTSTTNGPEEIGILVSVDGNILA